MLICSSCKVDTQGADETGCSAEGFSQKSFVPFKAGDEKEKFYSSGTDAAFQQLSGNTASDALNAVMADDGSSCAGNITARIRKTADVSIKISQSKMLNPRLAHSVTHSRHNKSFPLRFSLNYLYIGTTKIISLNFIEICVNNPT